MLLKIKKITKNISATFLVIKNFFILVINLIKKYWLIVVIITFIFLLIFFILNYKSVYISFLNIMKFLAKISVSKKKREEGLKVKS